LVSANRPGGVWMYLAMGRINHQPFKVGFFNQLSKDEIPMMFIAPSFVSTVYSAELAILRRQVTPWRSCSDYP